MQSCSFQLRQITKSKTFLTFKDLEKVIHAFISSSLDHCNALYSGIRKSNIHQLQQVQNAAAWLLTGSNRRQYITPVLASLHWVPVHFRINFKILLITFKAYLGLAPSYNCDMLKSYEPARSLRSSGSDLLTIPKSNLKTKGDRTFAVSIPKLWNDLPEDLRFAKSVSAFKSQLKSHFYRTAFM
ncbi:hypothetical protein LDENG_00266910 [Lucifuga dentata]|nr:hypothetical protein LDENG_00266910 [Lucifuga dentata]